MATREEREEEARKLFKAIGMADNTAKQVASTAKTRDNLVAILTEAGALEGCSKPVGALLYACSTKYPLNAKEHRAAFLKEYIMTEKIKTNLQLDEALAYLEKEGTGALNREELEAASGVGVVVAPEELAAAVGEVFEAEKEALLAERYHYGINKLMPKVLAKVKWAEGAAIKKEMEGQRLALLGPETEEDKKPKPKPEKPKKEKKPKEPTANGAAKVDKAEAEEAWRTADPYAFLPKPEENNKVHTVVDFSDGRRMEIKNSPAKLAEHLQATGGKVITRFPPEPNGYLHIGHAKAQFVDFGMAAAYGGHCYLRYDDTNPEAEKKEYIDHIQDIVAWLGWKPWKITYSSDYFEQLYQFALQLIRSGHAFVCHQTADEIKLSREKREPSPWRDRPIAESLALFEDMRRGLIDEGKATLRMRMDYKNNNYNMFDLIAYRIKFTAHPHAGPKWCIYPSYDYTHCIVDALENITHSLCTLEFETRRASYFWLLEVLDTYKPVVWEYARLNLTHNVLSKRKLNKLVTGGFVHGWDDPRLLTLSGLRRRGVTKEAINNFCREDGITRADSEVHLHKLDHHIRMDLDASSPRMLAVLRPLRVVITNLPEDHYQEVDAKVFPGREETTYKVPFTRMVYIEQDDFREQDSKDYYALAPGKEVMLKYAGRIRCTSFEKLAGRVTQVNAEFRPMAAGEKAPKGVLNWVGQSTPGQEPAACEVRLYAHLFTEENPSSKGDDWLDYLNPDSLTVVQGALANRELLKAQPGDRFQLERLGFFCVDLDSKPGALVLNRTCTLKESAFAASVKKDAKR
ncbi:hypothetical protein WJX72_011738 [[Myrmecia] bisecta]|uniref:glutamine--tRNA ligase n=1 Tax=[Myrmecia] bisecta TaxID=41462 RepID=A0AAW1QAZ0_9CHLO